MLTIERVCPVILRWIDGETEILAFRHPTVGNLFMNRLVWGEECLSTAMAQELLEAGGLTLTTMPRYLGEARFKRQSDLLLDIWYFFAFMVYDLPEAWDHQTEEDGSRVFSFFWHPLTQDLDLHWNPICHDVLPFVRTNL